MLLLKPSTPLLSYQSELPRLRVLAYAKRPGHKDAAILAEHRRMAVTSNYCSNKHVFQPLSLTREKLAIFVCSR